MARTASRSPYSSCPEREQSWDEPAVLSEDEEEAQCSDDDEFTIVKVGGKRSRATGDGSRAPKRACPAEWTEAEDDALRSAVAAVTPGDDGRDWKAVAQLKNATTRPVRDGKQCRDRYNQHAYPGRNTDAWRREEYETFAAMLRQSRSEGQHSFPWARMAKLMDTGRCDNDLKNKFNAMKRKKKISADDLSGPAAELIAFVTEFKAAEAEAPAASSALPPRRQQRAASADSDNGSASAATPEAAQQPREGRLRSSVKPPSRFGQEQAPAAVARAPPVAMDLFPDCAPTPLMFPGSDKLLCSWGDGLEQIDPVWGELLGFDKPGMDELDPLAAIFGEWC